MGVPSNATRVGAAAIVVALCMCAPASAAIAGPVLEPRPVVVLHGLNRTSASMEQIAERLRADGYRVHNIDYPSGSHTVAELTEWLAARLETCCAAAFVTPGLDFVTHSLGGILVRQLRVSRPRIAIRRVVMLSPPNHGSELVDVLRDSALFRIVTGPAGQELGTGADSVPSSLGAVDFELGVIAGRSSINPLYSWLIPGEDDGTVAVASTRVAGMQDFVVIDATHTFVMHNDEAIRQIRAFLARGRFDKD